MNAEPCETTESVTITANATRQIIIRMTRARVASQRGMPRRPSEVTAGSIRYARARPTTKMGSARAAASRTTTSRISAVTATTAGRDGAFTDGYLGTPSASRKHARVTGLR